MEEKVEEFYENMKLEMETGETDFSAAEDLSFALMNLVSLEEHFFMTGAKTESPEYYSFLESVREARNSLLDDLLEEPEGEIRCAVKHLLGASMRIFEVGQKLKAAGKDPRAESYFKRAFEVYSLVWGLVARKVQLPESPAGEGRGAGEGNNGELTERLGDLARNLLDCCD